MTDRKKTKAELLAELGALRQRLREVERHRSAPLGDDLEPAGRERAGSPRSESEARLNFVLETSQTGAWELDLLDHTAYRSLQHDRIFGYRELLPEWTYEIFLAHVLPEDRPAVAEKFRQALASRGDWNFECRIRRVDGEVRWIWAASRHFFDADGSARWMAGIVQDITERKELEEAIRGSNRDLEQRVAERAAELARERHRFYEVLETLPAMICLLSPDYRVPFANRAFREKFGAANGRRCYEYCFGRRQPCEFCQSFKVLDTGQPHQWEVAGPDGSIIEVHDFPFTDADGAPLVLEMATDITLRKREEEALKQSLSLLQAAMQSTADGILVVANDGRIAEYNAQFAKMWRLPEAILAQHDDRAALAAVLGQLQEPERFLAKVMELYADPERTSFDVLQLKDGRVFERYSQPQILDGQPVGRVWSFRDVGVRRQTEAALRESEERFRSLFENLHVIALIIDPVDGAIVDANPAAVSFYGWSREELLRRHIDEINMLPHERIALEMSAAKDEKRGHFFFRHRRADGQVRDVEVYSGPILTRGRMLLYSVIHDVTARSQAEKALQESERLFREAIEFLPIPIGISKADGAVLSYNRRFTQVFGYSVEDIPTVEAWMVAAYPEPSYRETVLRGWEADVAAAVAGQTTTPAREYRVTGKDGRQKYVEIVMRPVGGLCVASFYDLTEQRSSEIHLWEKTRELENLAKSLELRVADEVALRLKNEQILVQQSKLAALGETLGAIAHQWRQPLNSLGLIIQNLRDAQRFGELNAERVEETVEKSMSQISHMSKTIDDFRNFFQPDKEKTVFDTMRAASEMLLLFSAQLQANGIGYRLHCHPCNLLYENLTELVACREALILGYRNEFEHVLLNLVNNARDAILLRRERCGRPEQGMLDFDFYNRDGKVVITVADNGGGIEARLLDRVFDPYFTTKEPSKGTGLGLYMSKVIIEEHMGGAIGVANGERGAVFTIELTRVDTGEKCDCA